jgi:pyruvate/2-oxoglutarate/acetoin dehydrogenase E1 component/TPP-dependent pyruvate/acetoin dehydrogenase alpha subunit
MFEIHTTSSPGTKKKTIDKEEVINDFKLCCVSREASLLARKEVLTGKAKFGIIGDGKELPQVVLAKFFNKGDWRSGYYRDQTLMFALGISSIEDFFAQLYADHDNDPFSGGRQMNCHFATPSIDKDGNWTSHKSMYNTSSDISCTAGQMARGLGLAMASNMYRNVDRLDKENNFSEKGNEICFTTIGDASTSEGVFFETINAAVVTNSPLAVSVWDDGYGISVPIDYQTTKKSISKALKGFELDESGDGMHIYTAKAWDYEALIEMYQNGVEKIRAEHRPGLFHVTEVTQPQGHSTSGSHERYKTKERLQWEKDFDCIVQFRNYIIEKGFASEEELDDIRKQAKEYVKECKTKAWEAFQNPIKEDIKTLDSIIRPLTNGDEKISAFLKEINTILNPTLAEILHLAKRVKYTLIASKSSVPEALESWISTKSSVGAERYHTGLYSNSSKAAINIPVVAPEFSESSKNLNGYQILNKFFDHAFEKYDNICAFGEDVGQIGDVNQGFAGLQEKYGKDRIFDTGIREWTIMGQAIGLAMRGIRPIAEIQYLDYLLYGLEPLSDDLATLRYRSNNLQQAPAIIRTRGHRLEGIWHAGSPLGMIINSIRGMYVCVPRNMTQAAGMYNTLLQGDDPAIVIECLNGYRLKETMPDNLESFTVPLGTPEVLHEGTDVTLVTYGSCVRVAQEAVELLKNHDISVELIDVQTLLPFDLENRIVESLKKTNRIVFLDEDVPGGATAFMLQEVLEKQGGYQFLDAQPCTISAQSNRPPYGSDGDYFCKPNSDEVFEKIFNLMYESNPEKFVRKV